MKDEKAAANLLLPLLKNIISILWVFLLDMHLAAWPSHSIGHPLHRHIIFEASWSRKIEQDSVILSQSTSRLRFATALSVIYLYDYILINLSILNCW